MRALQAEMFDDVMPVEMIQERAREIRLTARDLAKLAHCNENTLGHAFAGKSRLQRATHQMIQRALQAEEHRLFEYLKQFCGHDRDGVLSGTAVVLWAVLLPLFCGVE